MNPLAKGFLLVLGLVLFCLTGFVILGTDYNTFPVLVVIDSVYLGYLFYTGYQRMAIGFRTGVLYNRFPIRKKSLSLEQAAELIGISPDELGPMKIEMKKSFMTPYADTEAWVECRRFSTINEDIYRAIVRQVLSLKHSQVVAKLTAVKPGPKTVAVASVFFVLTGISFLFTFGNFSGISQGYSDSARDLLRSGDLLSAKQRLFWALVFHRNDLAALELMADCCSAQGDKSGAKEYLKAIERNDPGYFTANALNKKLAEYEMDAFWRDLWYEIRYADSRGERIGTPEAGAKALALDPGAVAIQYDLIFVDLLNGFRFRDSDPAGLSSAVAALKTFIAKNPGLSPPLVEMGLFEWKIKNNPSAAIALFQKAVDIDADRRAKYYLMKVALASGRADIVRKYQLSPVDPDYEDMYKNFEKVMRLPF
jgi:tetratricopeptide (TPR) repeat protein